MIYCYIVYNGTEPTARGMTLQHLLSVCG